MNRIKKDFLPPPILVGYTYEAEESYQARNENRLLAIRIETNTSCNLQCQYCYAQSGTGQTKEIDFDTLINIIDQAKDLGVHSIVVIGGGEPTLHPRFKDIIAYIDSLGIIPMIFSNTILIDKKLAQFLHDHNVSVMGKLDSLHSEVQDFLVGKEGAFDSIQKGLHNLMEAGFTDIPDGHHLRLGISFVSNKMNLNEIEEIWQYCRSNSIFPNMEILTPTGRAKDKLASMILRREEIKNYKLKVLEIDRKNYGYDWLPYTPLTASGCLQYLYSLYITIDGDVRACAPTKFDQHPALRVNGIYPYNVKRMSLKDIYDSELFSYVRQIDKHLEGKCCECEFLNECIGCRGYAYSVGVNAGMHPYEALRIECQQCFK